MSEENIEKSEAIQLAEIQKDLSYIRKELDDLKIMLQSQYVTKFEFEPIKRVVYGLVGLVMAGVAGGVMTILLKK